MEGGGRLLGDGMEGGGRLLGDGMEGGGRLLGDGMEGGGRLLGDGMEGGERKETHEAWVIGGVWRTCPTLTNFNLIVKPLWSCHN